MVKVNAAAVLSFTDGAPIGEPVEVPAVVEKDSTAALADTVAEIYAGIDDVAALAGVSTGRLVKMLVDVFIGSLLWRAVDRCKRFISEEE